MNVSFCNNINIEYLQLNVIAILCDLHEADLSVVWIVSKVHTTGQLGG